jgi:hypothetical protein
VHPLMAAATVDAVARRETDRTLRSGYSAADLREEIAQCERHELMHDACMVRYVDLILR